MDIDDIISIDWMDDTKQTILIVYKRDGWTWEELYKVLDIQHEMVESAEGIIDIVVDGSNSYFLPKGGSLTGAMRKITNGSHPRQGHTIFVGAKGMLWSIANALLRLMGEARQKFHFAKTIEEAQTLLVGIRERRAKSEAKV